jgi:hypothetical protein
MGALAHLAEASYFGLFNSAFDRQLRKLISSGAKEHRQNAKNWANLEIGKTEKFAGNVY